MSTRKDLCKMVEDFYREYTPYAVMEYELDEDTPSYADEIALTLDEIPGYLLEDLRSFNPEECPEVTAIIEKLLPYTVARLAWLACKFLHDTESADCAMFCRDEGIEITPRYTLDTIRSDYPWIIRDIGYYVDDLPEAYSIISQLRSLGYSYPA